MISEAKAQLSIQDEASIVLAHAYRLAYQEYFRDSLGGRFSRLFHISKPKHVAVIARIAYRLKIVPFSDTELFVSDSCSPCTGKVEIVVLDPRLLADSVTVLRPSVKTDEDQLHFISQLKAIDLVTQGFHKAAFQSPFLLGSSPLAREVVSQLDGPESIDLASRIVESEFEAANHPEALRDTLSNFQKDAGAYTSALSQSKELTVERSRLMKALLRERYPIKEDSFDTSTTFEWNPPSLAEGDELLAPVGTLILGLKSEAKPEIDTIERQSSIERGRVEQRSNLEKTELERTYDTQIQNAEREMELEVRRLESDKNSYENQLETLKSQYDEVSEELQSTEDVRDELTDTDSTAVTQRLTDKIARLENQKDDLATRIDGVEQTVDSVTLELKTAKKKHANRIDSLHEQESHALEDHEVKLRIQFDAIEELKRRSISDKLAHVTEIEKERSVLEEIVRKGSEMRNPNQKTTEKFELPEFWSDSRLLNRKIDAIGGLEGNVIGAIDEALKMMAETRDFLQTHLLRLGRGVPSVTIDVVFPFWYLEIESGQQDRPIVETFIIPPSEVVRRENNPKEKAILGINLIPTMTSVASAMDSIKMYENVRACAQSNNQLDDLDPSKLLGPDSRWIRSQSLSKELLQSIQADFKRRTRASIQHGKLQ